MKKIMNITLYDNKGMIKETRIAGDVVRAYELLEENKETVSAARIYEILEYQEISRARTVRFVTQEDLEGAKARGEVVFTENVRKYKCPYCEYYGGNSCCSCQGALLTENRANELKTELQTHLKQKEANK